MKKTSIFLSFMLLCGFYAQAQQKTKTNYMLITISEFDGLTIGKSLPNMIITRTDSAQDQKLINFNLHVKLKDQLAAHENQILQTLQPYFGAGWKLVSTTLIPQSGFTVYRYFLSREQ